MNNVVYQTSAPREDFPHEDDGVKIHHRSGATPVDLDELAHELRQPLSTIESLAYYLEMTAADDQICRHLEKIRLMVTRANRILDHAC